VNVPSGKRMNEPWAIALARPGFGSRTSTIAPIEPGSASLSQKMVISPMSCLPVWDANEI
jgi:hypothetical protein